jgi:hypothetical protein
MSAKPRKRRGLVLTVKGEQKLLAAITQLELEQNAGDKLSIEALSDYAGLDPSTVSKVLACEKGCDRRTHATFFSHLGLALQENDVCRPEERQANQQEQPPAPTLSRVTKIDWGEAADVPLFFGRTEELDTLQHWVTVDSCRLVTILGMGGMGKTALAVKLAEAVQAEFDYVIWRSLREAPQIEKTLTDLIKFLSDQQETDLPDTVGEAVTRLMHYLQQSRCLLVLDNVESILQSGTQAGKYREGYENYETLIQRVGESRHQGCLVLTSREKPREVAKLEGPNRPVRTLPLMGLEDEAGLEFLLAEGLTDSGDHWKQVVNYYSGNPLALKIAANSIQDLFGGNIAEFLAQGPGFFGDIRDLLEQQFERLSELGQSVMYWLAINREATPIEELREDILDPVSTQELLETLEALRRQSLVERSAEGFTLQNVVMEYVTDFFIANIILELEEQNFVLLHSHSIIKATSEDYVRTSQIRRILQPVTSWFCDLLHQASVFLKTVRLKHDLCNGYAAGNLINILCQSQLEEFKLDFSDLTIRQAYLRGNQFHFLNFRNALFSKASLIHILGGICTIAFHPNEELLATGDGNGQIQLWCLRTRKQVDILEGHTNTVWSVAFSPDGKWLATGSADTTVRLWDVHKRLCLFIFKGHTNPVWSVAFSPDGKWLATGSLDATIRLWDVQQRRCLHTFVGHTNSVWSVTFSPDSQRLVTGSVDTTIRLWDLKEKKSFCTFTDHKSVVRSVAFSPDGQWLASGSEDATIRLWDLQKGLCVYTWEDHTNSVLSVAFSPDGKWLVSGGKDATIRLWDLQQGLCVRTWTGHTNWVWSVAF